MPTEQADPSRLPKVDFRRLSDVELMDRLRNGEHEALSHLFDRYHRVVLRIAVKVVRDRAEAEDVMQEVFFELFRFVDRFDASKGSVKGWIVNFAYHWSLNRRKYLALRGAFEDHPPNEFDLLEFDTTSRKGNGHSQADILDVVKQGLAILPPRQREVIELACLEGFLFREIADRNHESVGNVRHHYYRGIEKLRNFVRLHLYTEGEGRAAIEGADK